MAQKKTAATDKQPAAFVPKIKAAISVPSISLKDLPEGESFYFKALQSIEDKPDMDKQGKQKIDPDNGAPQFLHILRVVDLTTGQLGEIVLGHIVNKDLRNIEANGDSYIDRCYMITKGEKKGRTVMWTVFEIEDPSEQ